MPKILVVDHDTSLLERYSNEILRGVDAEIITAECGDSAWEILEETAVSMIISEMKMPCGEGDWLLKRVRALDPQPPFVVVSSGPDGPSRLFKLGVQCCFPKTEEGFALLTDFVRLWFKRDQLYRSTWG